MQDTLNRLCQYDDSSQSPKRSCDRFGVRLRVRSDSFNGWIFLAVIAFAACVMCASAAPFKTENVFLIISDGLRWQEVFRGAEEGLLNRENGVENVDAVRNQFWRETAEARRAALLPFVWSKVEREGQLFGNQDKGSSVRVTNGKKFSYPGYNEILSGCADPRIDSNDKKPNPNITVFEWLNDRKGFHQRVAVFGTWDDFPYIFNVERSGLPIWPTWEDRQASFSIAPPRHLAELRRDTTSLWDNVIYDSFLFHASADYVKREHPRVVFVGFGETDEWAHAGRYDQYLKAAHHVDDFVSRLWTTVQSIRAYRGKTTFILTADHGRGSGKEWKDHGEKVEGAENDWIAILGPDTVALGERRDCLPVTANQIAATIAALLGHDYHAAFPQTGTPIQDVLGRNSLPVRGNEFKK